MLAASVLIEAQRKCDGVRIVPDLQPGIDFLARLAAARTEVAVVVDDRCEARLSEGIGVFVEIHFLHGREAMRHDDRRMLAGAVWQIVPATKCRAVRRLKFNVFTHVAVRSEWIRRLRGTLHDAGHSLAGAPVHADQEITRKLETPLLMPPGSRKYPSPANTITGNKTGEPRPPPRQEYRTSQSVTLPSDFCSEKGTKHRSWYSRSRQRCGASPGRSSLRT
jgi:hypothetical protein